jgi:hypothetical protein
MDWNLAIRRNRDQLKEIVLVLFALSHMRVGGSLFTLPRSIFAAILAVLRPAESAVRRLIVIAAHGLVVQPCPLGGQVPGIAGRRGVYPPIRAFKLFDPLKNFDPDSIWDIEPVWESDIGLTKTAPCHDASLDALPIDATHLGQRLNALMRALDNLPHQARRLARWQMKRDALLKASKPTRLSPIRPGLPPGWRERIVHEVDTVLRECHGLANDLLNTPDTS